MNRFQFLLILLLIPLKLWAQGSIHPLDLNSLNEKQISSMDFTHKDFSVTTGSLKLSFPLANKNLTGSILRNLDLTKAGVGKGNELDYSGADFSGNTNPPKNFARYKVLNKAKISHLDLAKIGLEHADGTNGLSIGEGITLSKAIVFPKANKWNFLNPITYNERQLNKEEFLKLQDIFSRTEKYKLWKLDLNFFIGKLLSETDLQQLLAFSSTKLDEMLESIYSKAVLTAMPDRCRNVFQDRPFDPSWLKLGHSLHFLKKSFHFYRELYKLCLKYESIPKHDKNLPSRNHQRMKLQQWNLHHHVQNAQNILPENDSDSDHEDDGIDKEEEGEEEEVSESEDSDDQFAEERRFENARSEDEDGDGGSEYGDNSLIVNREKLEEAFETYLTISQAYNNKHPISVKFENELGDDGGGLTREFFCLMEQIAKKRMQEEVHQSNPKVDFTALGKMVARTVAVEDHVPSFDLDAPLIFYNHILHQTFPEWIVEKIYNPDDEEEAAKIKRIIATLQSSVDDFRTIMQIDSCSKSRKDLNKDTSETFLQSCGDYLDITNPNIKKFVEGFTQILPVKNLIKLGINKPKALKELIEGKKKITAQEFLQHVEVQSNDQKAKEAYETALKEILQDFEKADSTGVKQEKFISDFLKFASGSTKLGKDKFTFIPNIAPDRFLFVHTCNFQIDCPELDDVALIKERILRSVYESEKSFGHR